jgi:hypothetical protein
MFGGKLIGHNDPDYEEKVLAQFCPGPGRAGPPAGPA